MHRHIRNVILTLSLITATASVPEWIRSYSVTDSFTAKGVELYSYRGVLFVVHATAIETHGFQSGENNDDDLLIDASESSERCLGFHWASLGPGNALVVGVPLWFILPCTLLPSGLLARRILLRRRRNGRQQCPTCGYDLRATPQRCPECGAVATKN